MKSLFDSLVALVVLATWMAGIVLAKGFWLTVLAVVCPFYAWYLLAERVLMAIGWV